MARTLGVTAFPATLIVLVWLRLEQRPVVDSAWLWCALLALAPACAPLLWVRLALIVPAALVAAWVALDANSTGGGPGFFEPVFLRLDDGFFDYYDVAVPFSGVEQPHMHGVLALAIFGFCLLLGQFVAARRPLPAVLTVIAGAGWPATLYPVESVALGAVILAAVLWVLAGLRMSRPVPALVAGAVLVVAAAGVSTSAAVAKEGVLAWERWDPNGAARQVSVDYVWDANYGGIEFPKRKTTVLRIVGPERGLYWRATTLDRFTADRWIEDPTPLDTGLADGPLPSDPLLPARSLNRRTWVKQQVEVVALRDAHVVAATQPVALLAPQLGGVFRFADGIARVYGGLKRGQRYTAYSYAPRPEPAQLARVGAAYPPALDRFLEIGRTRVEPFGAAGRDARVDALFGDERYLPLWPYEGLWNQAQRLRAGARTPYGAVVAIETWLRSTGGFAYDQSPPPSTAGQPPLAHFLTEGKRGYCQHFAGAMALMLRFLGIPARVAAGFTSGKREDGGWTVTDHNAHAWVEVWFPGYGWLPFDPTPGRGSLAANYSVSSSGFNAGDAADAFGPRRGGANTGASELDRLLLKEQLAERQAAARGGGDRGGVGAIWILLALVVVVGAAIGSAKLVRRRLRYLTRDPRRLA
ncbi:MAG TPA: transglutaminase domain-containing protein, partial [Gaiellaceae bacterium]|nr:transglutaminase domain-containing protein [Gaiellaceae bacterium]